MRTRLEAHGSVPARATAQLGNYWTLIGARGKAETLAQLHQALGAARRQQDLSAQANVLQAIGAVQQFRKDTTAALGSYQQALGLFRAIGDRLGEANVLQAIGAVQQFRKDTTAALGSYQQALGLFRAIGDRLDEANVLQAIGAVQQFRKDTTAALGSYQQALGLFRAIGDPEQSQTLLHQALAIREAINDVYSSGADLGNYGIALLQRGRNAEAPLYLERARALFAARGIEELLPQMDALIAQARNGT
jgi:tetratricopeptide (TPR) repeat protein